MHLAKTRFIDPAAPKARRWQATARHRRLASDFPAQNGRLNQKECETRRPLGALWIA
jgi:hypothetical protein